MQAEILPLTVLAAAALVAGVVRGFAGFGGPMVLLPVATSVLGPASAVWVVIAADILVSLPLIAEVRSVARRNVVAPLAVGTLLTLPLGTYALLSLDGEVMRRVICAAILVASVVMLSGWKSRAELATGHWVAVGGLAGVIMGITSLAVTAALFLNSGKSSAAEARANFIVWVFLANLALLSIIALQGGGMPPALTTAFMAAGPAYFLGTVIGTRLYGRVDDATGRRLVLLLVAINATAGLLR